VKHAFFIFAGVIISAGLALLVLWQLTGNAHLREVAFAAGITLISAQVSLIPMALVRKTDPVVVFQSGFGGTVIHLFLTLAMGATAYSLRLVDRNVFLFLLLSFYWFSLIFVVTAMIKTVRQAAQLRAASHHATGA
jgi:predicted lysophospholipase L1 biosynthesis ABC-type transport system permease subunit